MTTEERPAPAAVFEDMPVDDIIAFVRDVGTEVAAKARLVMLAESEIRIRMGDQSFLSGTTVAVKIVPGSPVHQWEAEAAWQALKESNVPPALWQDVVKREVPPQPDPVYSVHTTKARTLAKALGPRADDLLWRFHSETAGRPKGLTFFDPTTGEISEPRLPSSSAPSATKTSAGSRSRRSKTGPAPS